MKKFFAAMFVVLAMCSSVFAADPCPQGASCNENYTLTGTVAQAQASASTKTISADKLVEARSRVLDKTHVISETAGICLYTTLDTRLDAWLVERPGVVVEKKEFLAPAYKQKHTSSSFSNECTTTMVIHYKKK